MNQYNLITDEIAARILAAWPPSTVAFGRKLLPFTSTIRFICILENVSQRPSGIRQFERTWSFKIQGSFNMAGADGDSLEPAQMDNIETLIQALLPYDETTPPTAAGAFAGISNRYAVTGFAPVESELEDSFYSIVVDFEVTTTVFS